MPEKFFCNSQNPSRATMASSRVSYVLLGLILSVFILSNASISASSEAEPEKEHVLTLDHSNFSDTVSNHDIIVVEFYAPWCGHCKNLAPEYEKAASVLSSHDPPVILAKIDANEELNKEIASQYEVQGFPTIKILRNGGKTVQDYKGPREADGIVAYLKKQVGPASTEIKSAADAGSLIDEKNIFVVGVFPKFSGVEFENFMVLAEKLRSDYAFGHTLDAKLLSRGESQVIGPTLRLLKPFDELSVDFQKFEVDAMEKFIEEASTPLVTEFRQDPDNHPFLVKFFESSNAKAMLFMDFTSELTDTFKAKLKDVAELYKGKGVSFLVGDVEPSKAAFEYFGIKDDQLPVILIQSNDGLKYLKSNVEPDHISPWLKEYMDGNVKPFIKSEPIPEVNDEPVKVVVADSLRDMVLDSNKNVLLEFYAPWCGHCKNLAPILDEVAVSFENDDAVVIAKLDATANDIPVDTFDVQGFPTLYFKSASGNFLSYDGDRTKEDIIDFIQNNRDESAKLNVAESAKDEL